MNDGWRGCAWRLKLTGRLVERGKDLAEGQRQRSKGILVRTWALNAKMLGSLCCGLELDPRGRRCPVKFWRRGDFWQGGQREWMPGPRRELRENVGPFIRWGMMGWKLEAGSYRQNIFLMGRRIGHAETESIWKFIYQIHT